MSRVLKVFLCLIIGGINLIQPMHIVKAAAADQYVFIVDMNIENQIRDQVKKPTGEITVDDLLKVKKLQFYNKEDLNLLTHTANLEELSISSISLDDWSFLSSLSSVKSLTINNSNLTKLPSLNQLKLLKHLDVSFNNITTIEGIETLTNLETLNANENKLTNIQALHDAVKFGVLPHLKTVSLNFNPLETGNDAFWSQLQYLLQGALIDISYDYELISYTSEVEFPNIGYQRLIRKQLGINPALELTISDLHNARKLDLTGVGELIPLLPHFQNLEVLNVRGNLGDVNAAELSALSRLRILNLNDTSIDRMELLSKLTNLEELYLGGQNNVEDITPLTKLSKLQVLELPGEYGSKRLSSIAGIENLTELRVLHLGSGLIRDLSPITHLNQLTEINLGNNQFRDLQPLVDNVKVDNGRTGAAVNLGVNPISIKSESIKAQLDSLKSQNVQVIYSSDFYDNFQDIVPLTTTPKDGAVNASTQQIIKVTFQQTTILAGPSYDQITMIDTQQNKSIPIQKRIRNNTLEINASMNFETTYTITIPRNALMQNYLVSYYYYLADDIQISFSTEREVSRLQFNKPSYQLTAGNSESHTIAGTYSNEETVDLTDKAAVTIENTQLAVIQNNKINALKTGTTKIKAVYQGKETVSEVKVIPKKPLINEVTEYSTDITGTAAPGDTIHAVWDEQSKTAVADQTGSFNLPITEQKPGTMIVMYVTDASGLKSEETIIYVQDLPPQMPAVDDIDDTTTSITGKTEPNLKVVAQINTAEYTTQSDHEGYFNLAIPLQNAGTKIIVFAVDQSGSSGDYHSKVVLDKTPPRAVTLTGKIGDISSTIMGWSEGNAIVTAYAGVKKIGEVKADYRGSFNLAIEKQALGTEITIFATDKAGNRNEGIKIIVSDITPPPPPLVNPLGDSDLVLTGNTEAGATVFLESENGTSKYGSAIADNDGNFSIPLKWTFDFNRELRVYATDVLGNKSNYTYIKVMDNTPPTIGEVDDVYDFHTQIKISFKGASLVEAFVGEEVIGSASYYKDDDFYFIVSIPKQKAGTLITLYAKDKAGHTSEKKVVTVIDKTPPSAPVVDIVDDNDTVITGKAEPNSKVMAQTGEYCCQKGTEGLADDQGNYSVTVNKMYAGDKIWVFALDENNNKSEPTIVKVLDKTAPEPIFSTLTEYALELRGSTEPNVTVVLYSSEKELGRYTTGEYENGFVIPIEKQKAGTILTLYAEDAAGNRNTGQTITVLDATRPDVPYIHGVTEHDETITGTAEPYSQVFAFAGLTELGSTFADDTGHFSIPITPQPVYTRITVYARDAAGNTSRSIGTDVRDGTPPEAPAVNPVSDNSYLITGKTEEYALITAQVNGVFIGHAQANENGDFFLDATFQKAGVIIEVFAEDRAKNRSASTFITVLDKTAPVAPSIETFTNKSIELKGVTEAGATINVTISGKAYAVKANATGKFTLTTPVLDAGTKILLKVTDTAGNTSQESSVLVTRVAPNQPKEVKVTNKSAEITGKADPNTKVIIKIGSTTYSAKSDSKGSYKIGVPVQNAGTKMIITAKDSAGKISAERKTEVSRVAPNIPIVNKVRSISVTVTGRTEKSATVTVKIGTKSYTAKATSTGSFTVKIPKQKTGTKLYVTAKDSKKQVSAARIVAVVK